MGHGPRLPRLAMLRAVVVDQIRGTLRNVTAAMRGHPMLFLPPLVVLVSGAIAFLLMSFVPVKIPVHGKAIVVPATAANLTPALHVGKSQVGSGNHGPRYYPKNHKSHPGSGGTAAARGHGDHDAGRAAPTADPSAFSPQSPSPSQSSGSSGWTSERIRRVRPY
jgi:hypothetical protein